MGLRLYSYFRSSAAYRVRIALNLKGLEHRIIPVHLVRNGGENNRPEYLAKNPLGLVPTLEDGATRITQSLAILEYLEESHPQPPLLPAGPAGRARVRAIAQTIACEIHPLNNLRVLHYLQQQLGLEKEKRLAWYRHWIDDGLRGVEQLLAGNPDTGEFCHGDRPTLADCCLVPQLYNARRFDCPLDDFPTLQRIESNCRQLDAFRRAAPEAQPDAE